MTDSSSPPRAVPAARNPGSGAPEAATRPLITVCARCMKVLADGKGREWGVFPPPPFVRLCDACYGTVTDDIAWAKGGGDDGEGA